MANLPKEPANDTDLLLQLKSAEQKQHELAEKLSKVEAELENLFKFAPTAIYEIDLKETRFVRVNDVMCWFLEYSREELLALNPLELLDEQGKILFQERIRKQLNGEKISNEVEYKIKTKSGQEYYAELHTTFTYKKEKPVSVLVIAHDITERKQLEESLRKTALRAEKRAGELEAIISSTLAGIIIYDNEGNIIRMNNFAQKMLGYEAPDFRKPYQERGYLLQLCKANGVPYQPDEIPLHRALHGEVIHGEEMQITVKQGKSIWLSATLAPILAQHESRDGIVFIFTDISERKETEEKILRQNVVLEGINRILEKTISSRTEEELGETCLFVAEEVTGSEFGFIGKINEAGTLDDIAISMPGWETCRMHLYAGHQLTPKNFKIHGIIGEAIKHAQGFFTNTPASHPASIGLPPGHPSIKSFLGVPLIREARVVGMIGVANREGGYTQDELEALEALAKVTVEVFWRKRAEQALRESEEKYRALSEELRENDRHKNEFMAILSHELRNPLAPILNSLAILDRVPPDGQQALRAKDVINRQFGQLARLIDDLLDMTRITQNKIELQKQRLELNELVRKTLEDLRTLFEKNEIGITTTFALAPVYVYADETRLAQVIGNLLQNTAKFTPSGGHARISVSINPATQSAIIQVADDGIGMSAEMLPRIFRPFTQADMPLDRSRGGLGLGLALIKGLVTMHGGEVSAHSAGIGKGAEFTVRLPLDNTPDTVTGEAGETPAKRSKHVLIVDDNIDMADSLREALELDDLQVEVAYDGISGLAKAKEFKPDVLVCDIGLPDMDGYAVARSFRKDEQLTHIFLIALTGYALPEDLKKAKEAGFDRHLAKPLNPTDLIRLISEES